MRGLEKCASGKPYTRLCNARRPRLEQETFRLKAVRLYRLHQARPSTSIIKKGEKKSNDENTVVITSNEKFMAADGKEYLERFHSE